MADLYSDPNQDPARKKSVVPGDPNAPQATTNNLGGGFNAAGGANGGIQTFDPQGGANGGIQTTNAVTAPNTGFDPKGSQPGQTSGDPGAMGGGNMGNIPPPKAAAPAAPTDPNDVPPVAGWVRYGNGGWAPPEIVNGAAAAAPVAGPANPGPQAPPTGPAAAPAGGITTAGQVTGTAGTVGGSAATGTPTTVAQSFQQSLVNRLNPQTPTVNDPNIAPAIQANQLAEQRGLEQQRQALAENGARQGNTGVDQAQLLGLMQDSAQRTGQYNAGAISHLSDLQNQNETTAGGMAGGLLSGNQASELQRYLGDQSAGLQRQSIEQQGSLGSGDLALRGRLGDMQGNLGLLGLLQGGSQFNQQLGQNSAQFGQQLDQSGLLGLLGLL
jgi:hypothetical protein